jgi:hypothetical protein
MTSDDTYDERPLTLKCSPLHGCRVDTGIRSVALDTAWLQSAVKVLQL